MRPLPARARTEGRAPANDRTTNAPLAKEVEPLHSNHETCFVGFPQPSSSAAPALTLIGKPIMSIRNFELAGRFSYELAADVFAVLMSPDASEAQLAAKSLMFRAWFVRELDALGHQLEFDPSSLMRPEYCLVDRADVEQFGRDACRQLEHRLVAGQAAVAFLQQAHNVAPEGVVRLKTQSSHNTRSSCYLERPARPG